MQIVFRDLRSSSTRFVGIAVAVFGLHFCCCFVNGQPSPTAAIANLSTEDQRIDSIIDQWKKRRSAINSIRMVAEGTTTVPKAALEDPGWGTGDLICKLKLTYYLDLKNGWYRRETESFKVNTQTNSLIPRYEILLYDGNIFRLYQPSEKNRYPHQEPQSQQIILVDEGNEFQPSKAMLLEDQALFFSIGCLRLSESGISESLDLELNRADFEMLDPATPPGQPFELLELSDRAAKGSIIEYVVDPNKDGAITSVRKSRALLSTYFGAGHSLVEIEYSSSRFGWFPSSWRCEMGADHKTALNSSLTVTEIEINPVFDRKFFQIREQEVYEPGMLVVQDRAVHTVSDDGESLVEGLVLTPKLSNSRSTSFLLVWVFPIIVLFGAVLLLIYKRMSKSIR